MILKLLKLLPEDYRKRLVPIVISILASTVLDILGIAVILPVFILLLSGGNAEKYPFLEKIYSFFEPGSMPSFIYMIAVIIVIALVIKYVLTTLMLRFQTKYVLSIYRYFSGRLFNEYYNRGYLFIKENGTVDLTYKINSVCYAVATLVLQPLLSIAAEGTIAFVTFILIAVFSPFSALAILVSFIPTGIIYMTVIRGRLIKYGSLENRARNNQFRVVQETLNGFPSIEINQAFGKMHAKFNTGLHDIADNRLKTTIISRIPNFMMEVTIILCITLLMITSSQDWDTLSVSLAFFCAGALRILPAIRSILQSYSQIKNNSYAVNTVSEALQNDTEQPESSDDAADPLLFTKSIIVRNLIFRYPDRGTVINSLSFSIKKGERVGIKGISGAGKTTLFNLLLGLYTPHGGEIYVDDTFLNSRNYKQWHKLIGYVPQDVTILNASIAENIAFSILFDTHRNDPLTVKELLYNKKEKYEHFHINEDIKERIYKCLRQASLSGFVDSLPDGIYTVIGENGCKISGGQRQRIGIARALFKNPEILFFDEATSALDSKMEKEVNNAISGIASENKELTIIIIAHRNTSLEMCNKIIEL